MRVTRRRARRMQAAHRERGAAALAHGHRSRLPVDATLEALTDSVVRWARNRQAGANYGHLSQLLAEREYIHIRRITLRFIPLEAGVSSPCRIRPRKHRLRYQRTPRDRRQGRNNAVESQEVV